MKKLMFALVAAGAAAVMGEEIASQNIVGFTSDTTVPVGRFQMMGVQFASADGNADGIMLKDLVSGNFTAVDYDDPGEWLLTSPQIITWDPTTLYTYYYYQTDAQGHGDPDDWGWVDGGANYMGEVRVRPGTAFWFYDPAGTGKPATDTVTFAGQVPDTGSSFTVPVAATGFTMVACPFPEAIALNSTKITWNNITAVDYDDPGEWLLNSPQIITWDPVSLYTYYYYQTDAQGNSDPDDWGWVDGGANYADPDTVKLVPGKGVWFLPGSGDSVAGSIVFTY